MPLRLASRHNLLPVSHRPPPRPVLTGTFTFDKTLTGARGPLLQRGEVTEIFGEAASGKTNFCLSVCVNVAISGKEVVYIDTEGGFCVRRLWEICEERLQGVAGDVGEAVKRVWVWRVGGLEELVGVLRVLEGGWLEGRDFGVVCVDSVGWVGRVCNKKERGRWLLVVVRLLKRLARDFGMAGLVVNQTLSRYPSGRVEGIPVAVAALGDSWAHNCFIRVQFARLWGARKFVARIVKSPMCPQNKVIFRISSRGVDDDDDANDDIDAENRK